MRKSKNSQASIELLFIIGFAMILIIPSLALFGRFVQETSYTATAAQIDKIGNQLITTTTQVYHGTDGSVIVVELNFPQGITNMKIVENAIVFTMEVAGEESELTYYADIPITGEFEEEDWTAGIKRYRLTAIERGTTVQIERWIKGEET